VLYEAATNMSSSARPTHVLYLVYWGALEPLGQSLVVPAILQLAGLGTKLTLVTFEKPADLLNTAAMEEQRRVFVNAGVHWTPLRYHKTPKWPATAFDSLAALFTALRLRRTGRIDIVHARTFVAGLPGYAIARILGARFVYHNEGFYPDEQVDAGVWKNLSLAHRLAKRVEAFIYDHADAMVTLSERAQAAVISRGRGRPIDTPVIVVPSAVDLAAFQPVERLAEGAPSLVYLGSVGGRYRLDDAGRFMAALRSLDARATLTVVSRAEPRLVETMLHASGLPRAAWTLRPLPHDAVPAELRRHHAGLLFWPQGLAEHGCSPTKVGEYWACGLPVVTTPNIGDTDAVIRRQKVGVVVDPLSEGSFAAGARELLQLISDPALPRRCRGAAETTYSLDVSCERQRGLYEKLRP
jgi:glycosyltransferase involved in cell wall biosynthesis